MIFVILSGVIVGILVKVTAYFFVACAAIALFFGASNARNFAASTRGDQNIEVKNRHAAILVAFVNGCVVALIASLACGGIARLFL